MKTFYFKARLKLLFFLTFFTLFSQTQAKNLSSLGFKHISTEHGLSQKTVQSIYQDKHGFLWIGTQEGLNRYDGKNIEVFRYLSSDSTSISNDVIRDIVQDKAGNLWIATNGGLNRFIGRSQTFDRLSIQDKNQAVERLNTLFSDSSGNLWIGSDGNGLFFLNSTNPTTIKKFTRVPQLENADVRAIFEDSRGRLWVGTDSQGLFLIEEGADNFLHFQASQSSENNLSHNSIRAILEDHKGHLWIGTRGGGLNRYNELSSSFEHYKSSPRDSKSLGHNRVYKILEDDLQRLWIATDSGVSVFDSARKEFQRIRHYSSQNSSLSHNRVLSIFQDKGKLIWIGTSSGLNQWNPHSASFIHYRKISEISESLSHNHIHGFAENKLGTVYVATFGGGLNYLKEGESQFNKLSVSGKNTDEIIDEYLTTLMVDNNNQLWIGSVSRGAFVYSEDHKQLNNFKKENGNPQSLSDNGVTDILQDRDGEIWISTYRAGLNRKNKQGDGFKHYRKSEQPNGLVNENILQMMEDDDGYIWIATYGGGLFKLDKNSNTFTNYANDPDDQKSLSGNNVTVIFQDKMGRFWVGTQGHGLNRWEPEARRRGINQFKHYTTESGLNSSTVNGVTEDQFGYIWVSTNRGVSRLNPETNQFKHYNLADEIHYNELNLGAMLKSSSNRIFLGGLNGISTFLPDKISENLVVPNVVLTSIESENRILEFDKALTDISQVTFDHNDYLISFEFASLDYARPSKNNYQYKLDGFDPEWVNNGTLNRATYTNLPSGSYLLRVRGSNNNGVWSEDEINLTVNILPAPWLSWWAFTFYAAGFCLLLIFLIRLQARRLASQEVFQTLVSEKVSEKTELYNKNTDFLSAKLEQLKLKTNIDLETGLSNQKYLSELIFNLLQWINLNDLSQIRHQFCVLLVRLPELNDNESTKNEIYSKTIKQVAHHIQEKNDPNTIIVRWGMRDMGILTLVTEGPDELHRSLTVLSDEIKTMFEIESEQSEKLSIKMSFALAPILGVNQHFFDGDRVLMMIEHLLHLQEANSSSKIIGIEKLNQIMSETLFTQLLESEEMTDFEKVFDIYNG
ncbi:hypothetical protein FLL45_19340 [Aliikangiella marina]|uniref:Two component regulator three Y domain-containing protein n=1 Tax=Aliikangiella marina TaxID=1712262 RepID=A0A545T577_9GAMM|nr:two-component regulator propeller domain-containing protein [Aliikangiella marina]TQV72369.1 hypothetical protein FLL45_19340 [Aliikangiella marina]